MSVYAFAAEFFAGLADAGVASLCLCPGSRSTPLAIRAAREPGLRLFTHVDERSAAFFALGLARASRAPVALVCTSGTAAANFLPAVVEAHHARVPLIVITADRPPELRDWGAGQTIDQLHIFGRTTRWYAELAPVTGSEPSLRYASGLASRAVAEALGHSARAAGPVHLNWPLREPLAPDAEADDAPARRVRPAIRVARPDVRPAPETLRGLAELANDCERGLIACGPIDLDAREIDAISKLARTTGWPIVADPASQMRFGPHVGPTPVLDAADLWLRDATLADRHAPDLVVRIGPTPVCKALRLALEASPPDELVLVDPGGDWQDPSQLATRVLVEDVACLCEDWSDAVATSRGESQWTRTLLALDARARQGAERVFEDETGGLTEPAAARALWDELREDTLLAVSNSMPIRHLDAFFPQSSRRVRVLANRGANGIDGVTSTALGAAATGERVVLLTGDLAFLHDLGGLLAATRSPMNVTIVVLENDGGGIFSFLPVAAEPERNDFERLFRVSHGLDLSKAAELFGARFERVDSKETFRKALAGCFGTPGLSIIEVPVDRDESVAAFRRIVAAGARAANDGTDS